MAGRGLPPWLGLPSLVVGGTLVACGVGMLVAAALGAIGDGRALLAFLIPGALTLALGLGGVTLASGRRRGEPALQPYVGFLAVTLAWVGAALAGSVPLLAAGTFDSPIDGFFEAMSGFTTTGTTLLEGADFEQPDAVFWWRSLMQWLGGIGIVVLVVAIAPVSGAAIQRAFFAEVSGVTAERLTPRIIDTAKILFGVYVVLTAAGATAYLLAGMDLFNAANHAFTTLSTGGFSPEADSIAAFDSVPIELVAVSGMILASINFAFYWRAVRGRGIWPQFGEIRVFLGALTTIIALLTVSIVLADDVANVADGLRGAFFTAATVMTGTGYTTADFDGFNDAARIGLLILMFSGGCAGATTGGVKVIRSTLLAKIVGQEIDRQLQPTAVRVLRLGGRTFGEQIRTAVLGFLLLYLIVFLLGALAFASMGLEPMSALGGAATQINIVGPGLGETFGSFQAVPAGGRLFGALLMLIGRLEVFTVVALLAALFGFRRRM